MKNLKDDIKNNDYKRAYLFYGEEDYLRRLYEKQVIKKIIPDGDNSMDLHVTDDRGYAHETLVAVCESPPFMADRRLAVFRDTGLFAPGKKDETERCEKYLTAMLAVKKPPLSVVIFSESKIDKRGKLYKLIEKSGGAAEFKTPSEKDLANWIIDTLKKSDRRISTQAAAALVRRVRDMNMLTTEMDKLIAYTGVGGAVTEADIELVCVKNLELKIFDMISAIGRREQARAVSMYRDLIGAKEQPLGILTLMARQFGILLRTAELSASKKSANEIAGLLKIQPFVVYDAVKQCKLFPRERAATAYADCLETDVNIKTGRVNDETGVELLIIKYSA